MSGERLEGTVAIVTGASSGIGAATARRLAADGATVVVAARRLDPLDALVAEVRASGGTALAVQCDVGDAAQAASLIESTVGEFGRIDTLVNNAGVMLLGPIEGADLADWERMISVNVDGLLACTHAALPHLLSAAASSGRGVADIVNLSSTAGRFPRVGAGVYNLVKHGITAFSESLRQEVTARNVRVSVVEPGAVDTELIDHLSASALQGFWQRFDGVERLLADDVADAISYIVTRPRRVAINEVLLRPTDQEF
ncbi:MAG: SDR family NAD(P)-dependent oxidoreductase [Actinomycetes bacterium]